MSSLFLYTRSSKNRSRNVTQLSNMIRRFFLKKSLVCLYIFRNATRDYFYIHDRQKIEVGPNINSMNVRQLSNMIWQFFLKKNADWELPRNVPIFAYERIPTSILEPTDIPCSGHVKLFLFWYRLKSLVLVTLN